jgi:hypothetical protein
LVTITGKSYRLRNRAIPNSNEEQASANSQCAGRARTAAQGQATIATTNNCCR